jgi:hypothetical protein
MRQVQGLAMGAEKFEQATRYARMSPEVKAKADHYKQKYGRF